MESSQPSPAHPHFLPAQLTATIGRAQEITEIAVMLRHPDQRLLTLTGPGGVGKTRLALEAARDLQACFQDGVFFVSLAPLREATLVLPTIAQTLGVEEVLHQPLFARLSEYLRDKHLLLVLDNFEHVQAAGYQISELLAAVPQLHILTTSREVLHLYGEHEVTVLPLAVPDLSVSASQQSIASSAAVALFVERARAIKPTFTLTPENMHVIAQICAQLDGLPLAIELAAARIKMLPPQALLKRLHSRLSLLTGGARNLPERQQTLRNTLDWSYDLLTEPEQRFFRRLGVFVGHWTLAAAEMVCSDTSETSDAGEGSGTSEDSSASEGQTGGDQRRTLPYHSMETLDLLTSLVDKSLVRPVEESERELRFTLLETIREYALDRLDAREERQEVQRRHAQYYVCLAEEAEPYLRGAGQHRWLELLDRESANLWTAMRWTIEQREIASGLRLAAALVQYSQFRGSLNEGWNWLEELLSFNEPLPPGLQIVRSKVLYGSGIRAYMRHELTLARQRLTESAAFASTLGNRNIEALSLGMLALLELHQGNYDTAWQYAEEGMQALEGSSDRWHRGMLHNICGKVLSKQGKFRQARTRHHISLMLLRESGDIFSQADVLINLGNTMRLQARLRSAQIFYQRGLQLLQKNGDRWNRATCLNYIGDSLRLQGSYTEAQAYFNESLALATTLGHKQERANALTGLGQIAICQGDMPTAARYLKESLRLTHEMGHTSGVALLLLGLGDLERLQGNLPKASDYYEQCHSLTRTSGDRLTMAGALFGLGDIARERQENEQACLLLKQSIHLSWELEDRLGLMTALEAFASLCRQSGLLERAVQFFGAVGALHDALQAPRTPVQAAAYEREIASLRAELNEIAFQENWSSGWSMALPVVLALVANIRIPARSPVEQPCPPAYPAGLTTREVEVLRLVAAGMTDARIAETLVLSPRTVNTHLRSIYAKLGISSRSAATRFAIEQHLA